MRYQTDTSARQLDLEYPAGGTLGFPDPVPTPAGTRPEETAIADGAATCAICQIRQVMVDSRRPGGTELFHTLCFRCYHDQMQRKRMAKQRRAKAAVRGASDDLLETLRPRAPRPREPKYRALELRRRQAQMAARRQIDSTSTDQFRARRIARAAALAGRVG
ncbi:MAG: hypothetical protein QF463_14360 [Vicinamibacterales bacterium]|nr:hypothetical protein [Acidobacteriota bacterium]MDP6372305.1 hypothetical protein [Vicinamibacterales bacterium]MDP6610245.1 hypothetical protein [Vicinamibacterales bacterium]